MMSATDLQNNAYVIYLEGLLIAFKVELFYNSHLLTKFRRTFEPLTQWTKPLYSAETGVSNGKESKHQFKDSLPPGFRPFQTVPL